MTLERTLRLAQLYADRSQSELPQARRYISIYEQRLDEIRISLQRKRLLGNEMIDIKDVLCLVDSSEDKKNMDDSLNKLATLLSMSLSFTVEALSYMVNSEELNCFPNRSKVRSVLRRVQSVLNDPLTRRIPKDGISVSVIRGETISRLADSNKYSTIRDILKDIRQMML